MIHFTIQDLVRVVEPVWSSGLADMEQRRERIRAICTDSRHLDQASLFVGIEGPHFDGAFFAQDAVEGGAICLLTSDGEATRARLEDVARGHGVCALTVPDARAALGQIASAARERLTKSTVFGITGSCGKTSTKGILATLLAAEASVVSSPASFNNDIGVPRTLFLADEHTEALVVEIGTNGPGEVRHLASIVRPRVAIVTCVGRSHLEGLGSMQGVIQEKGDLVASLEGVPGALCVLNHDCENSVSLRERVPPGARLVTVSAAGNRDASLFVTTSERTPSGTRFRLGGELATALGGEHFVPLLGSHAVSNVLLSLAPLAALGAPVGPMAQRLMELRPEPHRLVPHEAGGVALIDDTYNANPESLAGAIDVLAGLPCPGGRRTLVMGGMGELGGESIPLHRDLGQAIAVAGLDRLVIVGAGPFRHELDACAAAARAGGVEVHRAEDRNAAQEMLTAGVAQLLPGDVALAKASRSVGLDLLVDGLRSALMTESPEVTA